jgi:alpha-L-rhamnosidase
MFENIGGIKSDGPAFKHVVIAPQPGGKLTWAKVGYDSIRGPVRSQWKLDGSTLQLDVSIPANTTASIRLPTADAASIQESGQPLSKQGIASRVRVEKGAAVISIGSGTFEFTCRSSAASP